MVATSFLHDELDLFWQIFIFNGPGGVGQMRSAVSDA